MTAKTCKSCDGYGIVCDPPHPCPDCRVGLSRGAEPETLPPRGEAETPTLKAYTPGLSAELPLPPQANRVALVLNDYHIRNLRWLLRHAWHGRAPENLNTGDWCGEILWALEQAMTELGLTGRNAWGNGPDGGWPIIGYQLPEHHSKIRARLEIAPESANAD